MRKKKEVYCAILKAQAEIKKILMSDNLDFYRNKENKTEHDKRMVRRILNERKPFEKIYTTLEDERQKLVHIWYE